MKAKCPLSWVGGNAFSLTKLLLLPPTLLFPEAHVDVNEWNVSPVIWVAETLRVKAEVDGNRYVPHVLQCCLVPPPELWTAVSQVEKAGPGLQHLQEPEYFCSAHPDGCTAQQEESHLHLVSYAVEGSLTNNQVLWFNPRKPF